MSGILFVNVNNRALKGHTCLFLGLHTDIILFQSLEYLQHISEQDVGKITYFDDCMSDFKEIITAIMYVKHVCQKYIKS